MRLREVRCAEVRTKRMGVSMAVGCIVGGSALLGLYTTQSASAQAPAAATTQRSDPIAAVDPAVQVIRARLTQRLSGLPKIDEVRASGMPGLYEVRLGSELLYSDAQGNYFIRGELIDTRSQRNLTRERIDKLTAIDFDALPLQDAILWKSGNGQRRIAVFAGAAAVVAGYPFAYLFPAGVRLFLNQFVGSHQHA